MNEIVLVIIKMLPIILTLLLGIWIKRANFLSIETIRGITKLVLNIFLPCLLFYSLFQAKIEPKLLILSAVIFAVCLLTFLLGFLIKKLQKSMNQFYPSVFTAFLTGPLGFPLFIAYFGAENLYKLAILDVGNTVFIFTVLSVFLGTVSCSVDPSNKKGIPSHLKNLIKSPLTISVFLGIFFSLTGLSPVIAKLPLVASWLDAVSLVASATLPLTLIIVGFELPFEFGNFRKTIAAVLLRLAIMLAIAYLINTFIVIRWLGLDKIYQAALYTLFILPPPFIIPLSIIGECEHKKYVLDYISLHLIVSLIAFIALMNLI